MQHHRTRALYLSLMASLAMLADGSHAFADPDPATDSGVVVEETDARALPTCDRYPRQLLQPAEKCGFDKAKHKYNLGLFECGLQPNEDWSGCEQFCAFIECRGKAARH